MYYLKKFFKICFYFTYLRILNIPKKKFFSNILLNSKSATNEIILILDYVIYDI